MSVLIIAALLAAAGYRQVHRRRRHSGRSPSPASTSRSRYRAVVAVALILGCQILITAPPAAAAECGQAPNPQRPGSGLVGAIDTPRLSGDPSPYDNYGYAGMVWYTYDPDCGPLHVLLDTTSGLDTDLGNFFFNGSKLTIGVTNGLDHAVTDNTLFAPIYQAVDLGASKVYNNIYAQLLAVVALLLALILLGATWRGDMATVGRKTFAALIGLWLAASSMMLLRYLSPFDHAVVGFSTDIQNGFTADTSEHPNRDQFARDLHSQIIYTTWLRGEFGAPDAPQAAEYGMPLLNTQAFTVGDLASGKDGNIAVVDAKKQAYKEIAGKLGPSTDVFTGKASGRVGAGVLSLFQTLTYAVFPLLAKLTIVLAQAIFRLFIIGAPLLGLTALINPDVLRFMARAAATVLFNLLVVSVLLGVHTLIMRAVFQAEFPVILQIVIAAIMSGVSIVVARPLSRLRQTMQAGVRAFGGRSSKATEGATMQSVATLEKPLFNENDLSSSDRKTRTHAKATNRPELQDTSSGQSEKSKNAIENANVSELLSPPATPEKSDWLDGRALSKIPPAWGAATPNKKKRSIGFRWYGPNPESQGVRIDKGVPGGWPSQQVDHVVVRDGGKVIGRDGKPYLVRLTCTGSWGMYRYPSGSPGRNGMNRDGSYLP